MDIYSFHYNLNEALDTIPYGHQYGELLPFLSVFLSVFVIILTVSLILGLITYIFNAIGLYTMAKNRQFDYPWLAFIPTANNYLMGGLINDQVSIGSFNIPYAKIFLTLLSFASAIIMTTLGMIPYLGSVLIILISLAIAFYYYAALFRLFTLYDQKHSLAFLVLSIFFPFLKAIFIFTIRNKEAVDSRSGLKEVPPVSSKSIIGLSLGVISIIGAIPLLGSSLFVGSLGLIFSILALKELEDKAHGIALAGLICSIAGLVLTLIFLFACVACIGLGGLGIFSQMI